MPPIINEKKCTGCGSCVDVCPMQVLELKNKKSKVMHPDKCIECRACEAACPEEAISFL